MSNLYAYLTGFTTCAALIVLSGSRLARYGDKIASLTGWGRTWVGLILIATVTSLPELMTGIGSVRIIQQPDLTAGNVFGSCVFNLFTLSIILSMIDVRDRRPILLQVKNSHLYAGLFGIVLIALSGVAIMLDHLLPPLFWISPFSLLLIFTYLLAVQSIFKYTRTESVANAEVLPDGERKKKELRKTVVAYSMHALVVIAAALTLPYFGEGIARLTGLSNTFFGTLFMAAVTALPEAVVSFAFIKIGAFDLLMGNLLGSNAFNIFVLALTDIFYTDGSLFSKIKLEHLESVLVLILMKAVTGLGFISRTQKKLWLLSADTFIILLSYIALMVTLFYKT
jgi:cation:H+ antiporter